MPRGPTVRRFPPGRRGVVGCRGGSAGPGSGGAVRRPGAGGAVRRPGSGGAVRRGRGFGWRAGRIRVARRPGSGGAVRRPGATGVSAGWGGGRAAPVRHTDTPVPFGGFGVRRVRRGGSGWRARRSVPLRRPPARAVPVVAGRRLAVPGDAGGRRQGAPPSSDRHQRRQRPRRSGGARRPGPRRDRSPPSDGWSGFVARFGRRSGAGGAPARASVRLVRQLTPPATSPRQLVPPSGTRRRAGRRRGTT
jgi:hypothetical protein